MFPPPVTFPVRLSPIIPPSIGGCPSGARTDGVKNVTAVIVKAATIANIMKIVFVLVFIVSCVLVLSFIFLYIENLFPKRFVLEKRTSTIDLLEYIAARAIH